MANDFNASLIISTSEAVNNVRNLDGATKDLDKTLAHLHATMTANQGDVDKMAKALKDFTVAQGQSNANTKTRNQNLIQEAKLEREGIVNKGKLAEQTQKQAQHEAKLEGIRKRSGNNSVSTLGNETRRNAESNARIANQGILTTQRATTENARYEAQQHRVGAALATRSAAEDRAALTTLRLQSAQERARNSQLALNDSLSNSRYLLYDVAQTYTVLSAALLAVPLATTAVATSYEKDFTQVLRTTGIVGDATGELFSELKSLGREIPLTFGEFANIASIAGQLGIAKDEIGAFTETVAKFGAASNVGISEAATAFGRLENSFNQDGSIPDFYNRVGSAIAKVGVESAASETEIIAVTNQISAAGSQFGFTADQIVGLSGALASVRIRPELARGAFQRIMLNLSRAADEGADSFQQFGKYTGLAADQSLELFKNDPSAFFNKYIAGLKGTIDSGQSVSSVLDDIGAKNVFDKQFILGLANGLNVYNKALDDSAGAFKDGSFLSESTQATFETFAATLTKIGTALSNLGATLGGGSLGVLTMVADTVLNVVNSVDRLVSTVPAVGALVNGLLAFGAVTGVFLAFKAAQAFVLAGLVGLQQVMGKASIAGALSLKGNIFELSKTMLMAKGASAQMAQGLLANKTSMQQMALAASASTQSLQRYTAAGVLAGNTASATATKTGIAAGAFRTLGSGIMSVVGGPIGALVGALGIVAFSMISVQEESKQAGEAIARAMKEGETAVNNAAATALSKRKVQFGDGAISLGNLDKSTREIAEKSGVSFEKLVSAATKGKDAVAAITPELDRVAKSKGFKSFDDFYNSSDASVGDLVFLRNAVRDIGNESDKASKDTQAADDAVKGLAQSANQAAPDASALGEGLEGVAGAAGKATTKIQNAVDAIFGLVDAEAATQSALSNLGAGLVDSLDFGTGTEGGRENLANFRDALRNAAMEQQQLIANTGKSTEQASADYVAFIEGLMQELASRGVNVEQIQALADQAKGVFGATMEGGVQPTMTVQVDASKVDAARAYLDNIIATYGTTNLDVILREGGSKQVQQNVFDMQQYVLAATGQPYTVDVDSDTYKANVGIQQTAEYGYSVFGVPFTATVDANVDPATQALHFLAQYAATVVNGIIDGINTVNKFGSDATGGLLAANQIGHVGWGEMPATPKRATPAVPNVPKAPAAATSSAAKANPVAGATSGLGSLADGYDNAAKAAEKAGDAGKKAGEDMANGIDDATNAANDFANRLEQGLQSAFDKQYGLTKATDDYHSALNAIAKKRQDDLDAIDEAITKQKELNNSRDEDLVSARKAGNEKAISQKYGETDRAADYAQQEEEALLSAAAKQKDIDANNKTVVSLKAGIDNFEGYSDAAIANRAALRDLESKMIDMVAAYAATGASQEQVRAYAQKLTAQFQTDANQVWANRAQIGYLTGDMGRYISVINAVPYVKPTKMTADISDAMAGANTANQNLNYAARDRVSHVYTQYHGSLEATGNTTANNQPTYRVINPDGSRTNNILFNRGGLIPGFASGGLIPGRSPSDPGVDNMFAQVDGKGMVKVRSGEFIVQQPAVDYWGLDFFKNLNNMKMPAFNAGGSVGGGRAGGSGGSDALLVELTAENLAAILRLADRPIDLFAGVEKLASTVNEGNKILASKGVN